VSPSRSPERGHGDREPGIAARRVAIAVLARVDAGAYSHIVLPAVLGRSGLSGRDRALATRLVYGTLRQLPVLDAALEPVCDRALGRLEAPVRAALRLGAYQLAAGWPPHAALAGTVGALGSLRPAARGFVNAVLRRVAAAPPRLDATGADGPPAWLRERMVADLGPEDAARVLRAAARPAAVTLRPNRSRIDPGTLADRLAAAGVRTEPGRLVPEALLVRAGPAEGWRRMVHDGWATPQDEASQAVVALLDARPGERVLEVGAGPGGKATATAERMSQRGLLVAVDRHAGRLRRVVAAAARLDLRVIRPVCADGRALPSPAGTFDRVLVDAPCTGLGSLRRRPELPGRLRPGDPERLGERQRALVTEAARMLRPGGRLVYAVCTYTGPETLGVDAWLAEHHPDLVADGLPPPWRPHGRGGLLLADGDHDGMYALVLARRPGTHR